MSVQTAADVPLTQAGGSHCLAPDSVAISPQ